MKILAHRYESRKAPIVLIDHAESGHTYYSIGRLQPLKAMRRVPSPHFALIGERTGVNGTTSKSGSGGKGIVHDLYQAEVTTLQRIRFWLLGQSFDLAILHCEIECAVLIGGERIVCDNLLWLGDHFGPFGVRNLLNVEIRDTHCVDDRKKAILSRARIPTIEIKTKRHLSHRTILNERDLEALHGDIRQHLNQLGRVEPTVVPWNMKEMDFYQGPHPDASA
jgi:hypothetical protein